MNNLKTAWSNLCKGAIAAFSFAIILSSCTDGITESPADIVGDSQTQSLKLVPKGDQLVRITGSEALPDAARATDAAGDPAGWRLYSHTYG